MSSTPWEYDSTHVQHTRSLRTFVPVFLKARGLRLGGFFYSSSPRVDGFPVLRLLRPFRHFLRSSAFQRAFAPLLLPISLRIPEEASRVQQEGLKRNALGGVFLAAPSALCGSPVLTQGRSG